jgi:hypothetical protein
MLVYFASNIFEQIIILNQQLAFADQQCGTSLALINSPRHNAIAQRLMQKDVPDC